MENTHENIIITGFRWHHSGMAMEPYYIIWPGMDGYHWVISDNGEEPEKGHMPSELVTDEAEMKAFSEDMFAAGVLEWNGFSKSRSLPMGMCDGDSHFSLEMKLSDGSFVSASGSNASPDNYNDVHKIIYDYFSKNQDYSKYYPKKLPDAEMTRIEIKIGSPFASQYDEYFKLELTKGWKRWSIVMRDPRGSYLEKGTNIAEYDDVETPLPIEAFGQLLEKHDILSMNQQTENWDFTKGGQYLEVTAGFSGDFRVEIRKNINPADYDGFIKEFIGMTKDYYEKISKK